MALNPAIVAAMMRRQQLQAAGRLPPDPPASKPSSSGRASSSDDPHALLDRAKQALDALRVQFRAPDIEVAVGRMPHYQRLLFAMLDVDIDSGLEMLDTMLGRQKPLPQRLQEGFEDFLRAHYQREYDRINGAQPGSLPGHAHAGPAAGS